MGQGFCGAYLCYFLQAHPLHYGIQRKPAGERYWLRTVPQQRTLLWTGEYHGIASTCKFTDLHPSLKLSNLGLLSCNGVYGT